MSLHLAEEQVLLRDAARDALARHDTLSAARAALDGAPLPDLWPDAVRAGWPGLVSPEDSGGAGLGLFEALLLSVELGRVLAPLPLGAHWAAAWLASASPASDAALTAASGEQRLVLAGALPLGPERSATGGPARPSTAPATSGATVPAAAIAATADGVLHGSARWVPGAVGADRLIALAAESDSLGAYAADPRQARIEAAEGYDRTRATAHVVCDGTPGLRLDAGNKRIEQAWSLQQAVLGAEAVGAAEALLEMSVRHARARTAFGRTIGSFQAVKHQLVEVLRRLGNARALMEPAGEAWQAAAANPERAPGQLLLLSCALRQVAGDALDHASRTAMAVHGGMGVTWEHDAPLYFRRSQLDRRLLAGTAGAARVVGALLLERAREAAPA